MRIRDRAADYAQQAATQVRGKAQAENEEEGERIVMLGLVIEAVQSCFLEHWPLEFLGFSGRDHHHFSHSGWTSPRELAKN